VKHLSAVCGAETLCHFPLGGVGSVARRSFSEPVRVEGVPSRKNRPRRVHVLKRWQRAVGRKHPAGGRPSKEGRSRAGGRKPLGSQLPASSEVGRKGREGHGEGRNRSECPPDENLEGAKTQEGTVPVLTRRGWESWWVPLISRAKTAGVPVPGHSV
jgi:hypothetical protein